MITLVEDNKEIKFSYEGKDYVYRSEDIKEIDTDSIDNLKITDTPLKYLYRLRIRHSLLHNFMLYMPGKHILMLKEPINYFI